MPAEKRAARRQRAAPYAKTHGCPHCPATFGRSNDLRRHVQTVHEKRKDHQCAHCPKTFGQEGDLRRHVRVVHEKRRDYKCPHCAMMY